jgi:DNA invertase Pin-like site-specific DNA recombinase
MKAIGYERVSTDEQATEGISLDAQRARIEAYCVAKDWDLISIECDSKSGKNMKRPGLQRVIERLKEIDVLVVCKFDRLTRSVLDLNRMLGTFATWHVALVSIAEGLDATTANGELVMNLLMSVSQFERAIIGERTRDVMSYLKSNGRVHSGPVYGYDAKNGELIENEHEQQVIKAMKVWRREGLTYRSIVSRLNLAEVPTKKGGRWDSKTVQRLVLRPTVRSATSSV